MLIENSLLESLNGCNIISPGHSPGSNNNTHHQPVLHLDEPYISSKFTVSKSATMTLAAVKEKLHSYIDHADDKKLKAIYTLLENDMDSEEIIDEKMMKELDKRWENYSSGESKRYTLEESMKELKKHRNKK